MSNARPQLTIRGPSLLNRVCADEDLRNASVRCTHGIRIQRL
jgi:hypothetical protein